MLLTEIKKYLHLKVDYYKLTGVEKLSLLLSAVALAGIMTILLFISLFYLASALQSYLGLYIGIPLSYVVVSGIFIILGIVVLAFKKALIINPICRLVSKILIEHK